MSFDRAVFLDRDGVINRNVFYRDTSAFESPRSIDDLELFPWTAPALRQLSRHGFALFIVSNQPNHAKGKASLEALSAIHERIQAELIQGGVEIVESYYCLHHPGSLLPAYSVCGCRKPSPFFLLDAARKYTIDLSRSWMIGDRWSDVQCGLNAGVQTIRVLADAGPIGDELPKAHFIADDLLHATELILRGK